MAKARLRRIDRNQSYWGQIEVENLIARDHVARAIWDLTGTLERSKFNKSVESRAGADRIDPRLLISVWVCMGLTLGIGTARELERRLAQDPGLRWLCGDEPVNHHTLSDFRVEHGAALDDLFSQVLAALSQAGMVKLEQLTVDGTKIQAQASSASFRREATLRERLEQAQQVVQQLSREGQAERSQREAAQQRAARERHTRLEQALKELEQIRSGKAAREREQARVSLSEPEARVMKNGQGGFGPAYNVQSVVEAEHKIVVNVEVTQAASDQQQLAAALERVGPVAAHTRVIVDGGYLSQSSIVEAQQRGVELIGPALDREASRQRNRKQALAKAGIAAEFGPQAFRILEQGSALECPAGKTFDAAAQGPRLRPLWRQRRRLREVCASGAMLSHQRTAQGEDQARQCGGGVVSALYKRRGEVAEFPHA